MQDVPQIEAFSIPIHVELTELMELHFDFVLNCARSVPFPYCSRIRPTALIEGTNERLLIS